MLFSGKCFNFVTRIQDTFKDMKYGFDNQKYVQIQSDRIKQRIATFGNKLYMEFGGKLFDDYHASRVLPGFEPDSKFKMLEQMKDDLEIIIVISAEETSSRHGYNPETGLQGTGVYFPETLNRHSEEGDEPILSGGVPQIRGGDFIQGLRP